MTSLQKDIFHQAEVNAHEMREEMRATMTICVFPGCKSYAVRNEFCISHAKYFAGPKPEKPKKAIPLKSLRRVVEEKKYKKLLKSETEKDCEIKSPECTGNMQGYNHKQKRSPNNLLNLDNLERSCNACNLYIELNPVWAKENGHYISKFVTI